MKELVADRLIPPARTTCSQVLKIRSGERVLIITNPVEEVLAISRALYLAAAEMGADPVMIVQPVKTQLDYADASVLAALQSGPDVVISISAEKIGKDPAGLKKPYRHKDREFDHIFDYLLNGIKSIRALWAPGIHEDMFCRTVGIDYSRLKRESAIINGLFDRSEGMRISCAGGTDLYIGLRNRRGEADDGDFGTPGKGGNLPAGECFASPELGSVTGTIVFRGSISLNKGDILINEPIIVQVEEGFVVSVKGGGEAELLQETIAAGEAEAERLDTEGALPPGMGEIYRHNARSIGEIGIGLNPAARVSGNMLEDEKAYRTCHLAVGANYAEDAPALIHCDGLVLDPTISFLFRGSEEKLVMRDGVLLL
ncbi:aminopeptidase [Marispirochaeta sp.]|jgi:aminopeptidase|uniref:aminopeptidase n=1 Tax=Marispirochaeta sp. TaxID=2038653 RepID=UPI0029C71FC9|nr:aminopeptidase [Marispirochaeta sp.]